MFTQESLAQSSVSIQIAYIQRKCIRNDLSRTREPGELNSNLKIRFILAIASIEICCLTVETTAPGRVNVRDRNKSRSKKKAQHKIIELEYGLKLTKWNRTLFRCGIWIRHCANLHNRIEWQFAFIQSPFVSVRTANPPPPLLFSSSARNVIFRALATAPPYAINWKRLKIPFLFMWADIKAVIIISLLFFCACAIAFDYYALDTAVPFHPEICMAFSHCYSRCCCCCGQFRKHCNSHAICHATQTILANWEFHCIAFGNGLELKKEAATVICQKFKVWSISVELCVSFIVGRRFGDDNFVHNFALNRYIVRNAFPSEYSMQLKLIGTRATKMQLPYFSEHCSHCTGFPWRIVRVFIPFYWHTFVCNR